MGTTFRNTLLLAVCWLMYTFLPNKNQAEIGIAANAGERRGDYLSQPEFLHGQHTTGKPIHTETDNGQINLTVSALGPLGPCPSV